MNSYSDVKVQNSNTRCEIEDKICVLCMIGFASVTPVVHNVYSNVEQDHTRGSIIQLYRPPRRVYKTQEWQATQSCRQYKSYLQSGIIIQTIKFSLNISEFLNGYNVIIVGLIALVPVFTSLGAKIMLFILALHLT